MFRRYVLLAHHLEFHPMSAHANAWEFMDAVTGGKTFRVWNGNEKHGSVAVKGMVFSFKSLIAAEAELDRARNAIKSGEAIKPSLYVVSALSNSNAMSKVLDHVYLKRSTGAERIQ